MILYHGSNILIKKVDLNRCRPFKDFGKGFYCTTLKEQAELMAKRVTAIFGGTARVSQFELDERVFNDTSLRIIKFEEPSKEWAMFVLNNRNRSFAQFNSMECNHDNKYDLVSGPIANDNLAMLFRTFTTGLIDLETLIKGMKYKKLTNQYSFHSESALRYLKSIGGI